MLMHVLADIVNSDSRGETKREHVTAELGLDYPSDGA